MATDNFDRADNADLGADWAQISGMDPFKIVSNAVQVTTIGNDTAEIYTSGTFADDQYSQVVLTVVGGSSSAGVGTGLALRGSTGANTFYRIAVNNAGSPNIEVGKNIAGSFTQLGTITQAFSDGDTLKFEVTGQDASIVLKVYRNGAQIGSDIPDSTGTHINSGRPGLFYSSAVGNTPIWDNWAGGDLAAAAQHLAPTADSVDGNWTDQAGGTSLAAAIDETTFSDTDYIRSELGPANSACRVKLAAGGDPQSSSGHIIHWRAGKDTTGGATIGMTIKLYQGGGNSIGGGTLIKSYTRANVDAFTTYDETALSAGEADSITNYADLYLEFWANQT